MPLVDLGPPESCAARLNGNLAYPSGRWTVMVRYSERYLLSNLLVRLKQIKYYPNDFFCAAFETG